MSQLADRAHLESFVATVRELMQRIVSRHAGYRASALLKPDDHATVLVFVDDDRIAAGKMTFRSAKFEVHVPGAPADRPKLQAALSERFSQCLSNMVDVPFEAEDADIPTTGTPLFGPAPEEQAETSLASVNSAT